jgi:epoxyqueuosine reductase
MDYYDSLREKAIELGADLFGVAETARLEKYIDPEIAETAKSMPYVVSIAVRIQRNVLETLTDGPNFIYKAHYRQANNLLDKVAFELGQFISNRGFGAMPIPASVIVSWSRQTAHLSHRHAAELAGIGFVGRHGLVVHPEYGAAIRLASIFTDMPVHADTPLKEDCGDCCACLAACPVEAISINGIDEFNGKACFEKLKEYQNRKGIGVMICGLCVKACKGPGKKK